MIGCLDDHWRVPTDTLRVWIAPTNTILLATDNPTSEGPVAWISAHEPAHVVCIQIGHGPGSYRDPGYRALVRNALPCITNGRTKPVRSGGAHSSLAGR